MRAIKAPASATSVTSVTSRFVPAIVLSHRINSTGKRFAGRDVARTIKKRATAVGLDPGVLSGHSLGAGFVTTATRAGESERAIQTQTRHRSSAMPRRCMREIGVFEDNAAVGIGL